MKFVLVMNLKLLTIANSFLLNIAEHENFSANKYENANYSWHFHILLTKNFSIFLEISKSKKIGIFHIIGLIAWYKLSYIHLIKQ